jgi:hypothetical protein
MACTLRAATSERTDAGRREATSRQMQKAAMRDRYARVSLRDGRQLDATERSARELYATVSEIEAGQKSF